MADDDLPTAQDVLDALATVHQETDSIVLMGRHRVTFCVACSDSSVGHRVQYPCPTLRAVTRPTVESKHRATRALGVG